MPYKDMRPYSRIYLKREYVAKIKQIAKRSGMRIIDVVSEAVDKYIKATKI